MKNSIFTVLLFLLISCNQTFDKTGNSGYPANPANLDSLNTVFLAGWNNHDSAAILNTFADNAIVFNDSIVHTGKTEIADQWVSRGVKVLGNIKTVSSIRNSNDNIAYDAGKYTLDITLPDVVLKEMGNYSIVWEKHNGTWEVTMLHIEDVSQMPDVH